MIFSCVIPAKDPNDQKLKDLISSIRSQDFPQDQIETIVVTEGDSEQAKAIGIRQARGQILAMFCSDNFITIGNLFTEVYKFMTRIDVCGVYSRQYAYLKEDNSLNKYFSLIGVNDPVVYYLGKADRQPWFKKLDKNVTTDIIYWPFDDAKLPTLGDNGFFIHKYILEKWADLDHYYIMDVYVDVNRNHKQLSFFRFNFPYIWHRTSDNFISFLKKRYCYARDLYSDRTDRRWKMVDTTRDKWMLVWFVISTLTIIPCLLVSIRGFLKVRDSAWFWHWPVSFGFLVTYSILAFRNLFKHGRLFQCKQASSYQAMGVLKPSSVA